MLLVQDASAAAGPDDGRIYILGIGNVGRLFAHSLARLRDPPPITLLLHRAGLAAQWREADEKIEIITAGASQRVGGFQTELLPESDAALLPPAAPVIRHLVVATKATQVVAALAAIRHRLAAQSAVLFTQNGMGIVDEVRARLFPKPESAPAFLTGVVFHGIHAVDSFSSRHAGVGFIPVGDARLDSPTAAPTASPAAPSYLVDRVTAAPAMHAVAVSSRELLVVQLEKLVVNVVLNPLTALFRLRNGDLYSYPRVAALVREVIRETHRVILALLELASTDLERAAGGFRERFSEDALGLLVREKALMTAENRSSMLQDVEAGRETEIQFINGWVVRRGRELGVDVRVNEKVVDLVQKKSRIAVDSREIDKVFGKLGQE